MFARILEVTPRMEKKDEFIKTVRQQIHPILKKQPGFLEMVPLIPEAADAKWIALTLWTEKHHAETYLREVYPKVEQIMKPFLVGEALFRTFNVETSVCEHLVEALTTHA
ncbi:MAG TPA: antibiotic biosynthesis monooxygenase [Candidatus Acidoferrales bacterium]|jgi:quinol monooxygenase YgiN|nr:antibiotic biosynthesis monooxygenase [Candidatus Acidoferrales bacterium]